jgi:hypothetical protein
MERLRSRRPLMGDLSALRSRAQSDGLEVDGLSGLAREDRALQKERAAMIGVSKELREQTFELWGKLSKDEKAQIFDGNWNDSGGRATDVSGLAHSTTETVKQFFPINGVPEPIVILLKRLTQSCADAENDFARIVLALGEELLKERAAREAVFAGQVEQALHDLPTNVVGRLIDRG